MTGWSRNSTAARTSAAPGQPGGIATSGRRQGRGEHTMVTKIWHETGNSMMRRVMAMLLGCVLLPVVGCKPGGESAQWLINGFLDPTQTGQFLEPKRNEIRSSLSILEEPVGIQDASDPGPQDLEPEYAEHIIIPGDVINVSIFELLVPGQATGQQIVVSTAGFESLPSIGRVRLTGLTLSQLEMELKEMLREQDILPDPEVQVSLVNTRGERFSVIGSISRPGTYEIPQPEYRLLQAIADAGGVSPIIPKIYVFRRDPDGGLGDPGMTTQPAMPGRPGGDNGFGAHATFTLSDTSGGASSAPASAPALRPSTLPSSAPSSAPTTASAPRMTTSTPARPVDVARTAPAPARPIPSSSSTIDELRILEGKPTSAPQSISWDPDQGWVIKPMPQASPPSGQGMSPTSAKAVPSGFVPASQPWPGTEEVGPPQRIIEIPTKELLAGDPRYNIVIRPFDMISVPPGAVGEFYMMGNIARPGAYDLTGRRLTVKEAIASAGGFGPLAWPSRADLIRRVSQDEEQIIQLDLDSIFAGNAPDFYLKPNDIVNVGTTPAALFLAVLRNAFRFSYGFGFVYDRNFADSDTFAAQQQIKQTRIQEAQLRGVPLQ